MNATENEFFVNASDLRQYAYCPRVLYYRYVMPVKPPSTHLMKRGLDLQQQFERLEPRRTLSRYGLEQAERRFRVRLSDKTLAISAEIDLVLLASDIVAVVEFKTGVPSKQIGHELQLAACALLARCHFKKEETKGFLLYKESGDLIAVDLTHGILGQVKHIIKQITDMVRTRIFPDPPQNSAKCEPCEFKFFCADIF